MTILGDDDTSAYLRQLQPRDLADLFAYIHHDMSMLVGSYTSYVELLELQLANLKVPVPIATSYRNGIQAAIDKLHVALAEYLQADQLSIADARLLQERQEIITFHLRAPLALFYGWADLLQFDLDDALASPVVERAQHLMQAMRSTADRMSTISFACLHKFPEADSKG